MDDCLFSMTYVPLESYVPCAAHRNSVCRTGKTGDRTAGTPINSSSRDMLECPESRA